MSFKDFIAGAVIDGAEAIGATGISQTDGFVNTVINYLSPTLPTPEPRGFSQLGGFFSSPERYPRKNYVGSSTYAPFERTFSGAVSRPGVPLPESRYQGKAFYENADRAVSELREGMDERRFVREEPAFAPPMRAPQPPPFAKTAEKIRKGLDRGDDKFVREKPAFAPPNRKPQKMRRKRVMQPPDLTR